MYGKPIMEQNLISRDSDPSIGRDVTLWSPDGSLSITAYGIRPLLSRRWLALAHWRPDVERHIVLLSDAYILDK